jgi:hypothetical protein
MFRIICSNKLNVFKRSNNTKAKESNIRFLNFFQCRNSTKTCKICRILQIDLIVWWEKPKQSDKTVSKIVYVLWVWLKHRAYMYAYMLLIFHYIKKNHQSVCHHTNSISVIPKFKLNQNPKLEESLFGLFKQLWFTEPHRYVCYILFLIFFSTSTWRNKMKLLIFWNKLLRV